MKKSEILRVSRLCLANLDASSATPSSGSSNTPPITIHDESDLSITTLCSLWGGMGHIYKITTTHPSYSSIIKHVAPPRSQQPSFGDRRKADSYIVEANFYDRLAPLLIQEHGLNLPRPLLVERSSTADKKAKSKHKDGSGCNGAIVIGMSFIEEHSRQYSNISRECTTKAVLTWLATLHAAYWGQEPVDAIVDQAGLQPQGSYWYLDTRPDEHASMPSKGWEGRLKRAARAIDARLKRDPLQCIIHGDPKDANVLITNNTNATSAADNAEEVAVTLCDFQYCGKGPPTKDLAYYFCSSVNLGDNETMYLEFYWKELVKRLPEDATPPTMDELQESLDLAYCDFYRFMSGWGFWGSGGKYRVLRVLERLDGGKLLDSEEAYDEAMHREYS